MLFKMVDFPAPFGPISVRISLFSIRSQYSVSAAGSDIRHKAVSPENNMPSVHSLLFPVSHHPENHRCTKHCRHRADTQLCRCKQRPRQQITEQAKTLPPESWPGSSRSVLRFPAFFDQLRDCDPDKGDRSGEGHNARGQNT